jgi:hypothetical protein
LLKGAFLSQTVLVGTSLLLLGVTALGKIMVIEINAFPHGIDLFL